MGPLLSLTRRKRLTRGRDLKGFGSLECSKAEYDCYMYSTYSHEARDSFAVHLSHFPGTINPRCPFCVGKLTAREIHVILRKARACSALGTNGVPYKANKYYQELTEVLIALLRGIWLTGDIPRNGQVAALLYNNVM